MAVPRRLLLAPIVLLLALLALPQPVAAHAYLQRAEPPPDAVLPTPPPKLQLWFTETLEPDFSEIVVVDAERRPVHTTTAQASADRLSLTLDLPPLPAGAYTVTWKTLSAVDGHAARGFYSLTIGQPGAPAPAPVQAAEGPPVPVQAAVRWLAFTGQALIVGSLLFHLLVLVPALAAAGLAAGAATDGPAGRRRAWLERCALAALALAALGLLLSLTVTATGLPLAQAVAGPLVLQVLGTRYGVIWLARLALIGLLAGLLLVLQRRAARPAWASWLGVGLGLALLLTTSLTSHAAALLTNPTLAVLADWLHLTATSLWIGGLAMLLVVAPAVVAAAPPESRLRLGSAIVRRFSTAAMVAVGALVATGVYAATQHFTQLDELWTTDYGRTLLSKVLLLLPMLALGALNLLGVRPALAQAAAVTRTLSQRGRQLTAAGGRAWTTMGRAVRGEFALGLLILAATGVLTSIAPIHAHLGHAVTAPTTTGVRQVETVGDLRIVLTITPAQAGDNTVEVAVTRNGAPAVGVIGATVRFSFLDEDLGENEVELTPVGDATYVRRGPWLSVNGEWQANVIIKRIAGQEEVRTAFRFAIPTTALLAPDLAPAVFALPNLSTSGTVALVMLALAGALIAVAVRMRRAGTLSGALFGAGAGALALAVYLLATGGLAAAPSPPTGQAAGPRNPFPATAQSLAQGRTLYTANCQSCHGVGGKGDGPQAASLNPPPLDLTQHVGFHSDAELNRYITQGVRGTAMPPFAGQLSQEEIWHLVNYIKTFDAFKGSG